MNILSLDTCFDACSVAVQRRDGQLFAERQIMRRGHAEALVPMIARVMANAATGFDKLDRIAVTAGPGTFTGARVGMSAALGIALAHQIDIVTYSSLACIARAATEALGPAASDYDGIIVVRDARRDSVYWELLDTRSQASISAEPELLSLQEANARLATTRSAGHRFVGVGSGLPLLNADDVITPLLSVSLEGALPDGIEEPDARFMLSDVAQREPDPNPVPLYLRAPDAKPSSTPPLPWQSGA